MRRREGPVLNKQTGFYYFCERVGLGDERRRIRVSLHTRDPARAQWLWEQEWKRRWGEHYGLSVKPAKAPVALREAVAAFVAYEQNVRRVKDWRGIRGQLRVAVAAWGGERPLRSIGHDDMAALDRALRAKGRAPGTINLYFTVVRMFFAWAIREGYHPGPNPAKDVRPYVVEPRRRAYSADEIRRIFAAATKVEAEAPAHRPYLRQARRIVLLLYLTGMRAGEALNLKWAAVGPDSIIIPRTETKARREKVIPLTPAIRAVLDELAGQRKDDYVLPLPRHGRPMRATLARQIPAAIREASGVRDFEFHGLRHTAATRMVAEALGRGAGLADVMKVLGHALPETTLRYQHADLERMRRAMGALEPPLLTRNGQDDDGAES